MDDHLVRRKMIEAGVKNLKTYGYPAVTPKNILTDQIYSAFFRSMLEDTRRDHPPFAAVCDGLLADLAPLPDSSREG